MGMNISNSNESGSGRRRRNRVISEINVTPLVDVMLVLLIIFMVTSPMLVSGIDVDLPTASASNLPAQDEPLSVTIDSNGDVFIMDTMVAKDNLVEKLAAITQQKLDSRIFVRGDKSANYGQIIEVMSMMHMAGFTKVALITQVEKHDR